MRATGAKLENPLASRLLLLIGVSSGKSSEPKLRFLVGFQRVDTNLSVQLVSSAVRTP